MQQVQGQPGLHSKTWSEKHKSDPADTERKIGTATLHTYN
jgi:inosine/xanthosine triphosphate pyrophosphatase family protein